MWRASTSAYSARCATNPDAEKAERRGSLHRRLCELYIGSKLDGIRFRYALLAFDLATVLFIVCWRARWAT
jgi:hypothetical protein